MRTKKTTKPAPILASSSSENGSPEKVTNNDPPATNGTAEDDPSDSVILIENDSINVPATENGIANDKENDDAGNSSSNEDKPAEDEPEGKEDTGKAKKPPVKVIRLVSIEKLMRPSLLPTVKVEDSNKRSILKTNSVDKPSSKRSKNASVIEISDTDEDEDDVPLSKKVKIEDDFVQNLSSDDEIVPVKKKLVHKPKKAGKIVIDDDEEDEPLAKRQNSTAKSSKSKQKQANVPDGCKNFKVRVQKLPADLKSFIKDHSLSSIIDQRNQEITAFKSNTNYYGELDRRRKTGGAESSKSKAKGDKKGDGKNQVILSSESDNNDSDEPIASIISKSDNIPKNKTMSKRAARSRRQLSESEDAEGSDEDFEVKSSKAKPKESEKKPRGRGRPRKKVSSEEEEEEEKSGSESDDFEEEKPQPKKKRSRIKKNSSSSSDEDGGDKKKRKRSKKNSGSEDEDDSPTKGRKNIRKLLKKSALEQTTKEAEQEEKERKQRIAERQKMYNQVYDEKPEEVKEIKQLVLDFDEESKEPLLQVDEKLVKKLKPHQANGIKFMFDACFESLERARDSKGSGCILAHCMGLGKTLQVVTLSHTLLANCEVTGVERILVVCPLSTVLNWVNEFRIWMKHVKKGTEVEVYEISKYKNNVIRANQLMEWHNEGGVMILGYDMFRNLSNQTTGRIRKKVRESLQTSLIDPGPDLIICDEGHLLKNEKTSLSKAVNRIRTLRRIVLTGTPIQNNMKEYYCMVQFVKPKLLGTYNEYMNRFVNPITNGQYTDSTPYDIQLMRKRAHVLHKLLDGCVQRRDYAVLAPFLPPKLEFVVSIRLTPLQCTLYKYYMETQARKQNNEESKRASVLFSDFQNLQRIWTHPRVLRYNSDRYEYMQQKKRDMMSDDESIGSMKDFLDDEDSEAEDTPSDSESESSSGSSDDSDGSHKKSKKSKKKADKKSSSADAAAAAAAASRRTRNNPDVEEEDLPDVQEQKNENPTEWWMSMVPEEELDNLEHSGKLQVLFEILKECEAIGDKLLVFSQSLYSLDVIEHFLSLVDDNTQKDDEERDSKLDKYQGSWTLGLDYFRLDGSTAIESRNAACKVFNDESNHRARLFLISTRAGGLGINLVAANRVIIFDVSWNPSHDIQSIFRVYRFGQIKPCYIYRFLAMGTMEEKIYERQVTKQAISKRVIDEQQIDRHYKENDLQELYRYDNIEPEEERPVPNLPKDRLFAELLKKYEKLLYKYHEHDSLLENKEEETLNEEERKAAWEEFEQEKNRPPVTNYGMGGYGGMGMGMGMNMGMGRANGPVTSSNIFGFRTDVLLKLLNMKARQDNPSFNETSIAAMIPYLMQELVRQMKDGDLSMYKSLTDLYYQLEAPQNMYSNMGYNQMMMQPQQVPMMQQQHMQRPMMANNVNHPGAANSGAYSMDQIRYLRQQEQLRYLQMNEASSSGANRGTIISEAQKRFMNNPVEIVELD